LPELPGKDRERPPRIDQVVYKEHWRGADGRGIYLERVLQVMHLLKAILACLLRFGRLRFADAIHKRQLQPRRQPPGEVRNRCRVPTRGHTSHPLRPRLRSPEADNQVGAGLHQPLRKTQKSRRAATVS
jgi:hypothetical protein